jgi:hypothetical protein
MALEIVYLDWKIINKKGVKKGGSKNGRMLP